MIRRWLPIIALIASTVAIMVAVVVYVRLDRQDGRVNRNRVAQTRQSCHERNVERHTLRRKVAKPLAATFRAQQEQTRRVPVEAFQQFQVTKREAISRLSKAVRGLEKAKAAFHSLDCKARVQAVRDALN